MGCNLCCSLQASPDPVVTWLKDGLPLSKRAMITTKDGITQLRVSAAIFTDSGTYTVELQNGLGKKETFSFQVQVTGNSFTAVYRYRFAACRQWTELGTGSFGAVKPHRHREN